MIKWGHMNVCTSFFFTLLVVYSTLTRCGERAISYWTSLEINSGAQVTWANKPTTYIHIKFIHIISIVSVVYSNGIKPKILMSHWRHLTKTFKLPQASYIVLLDNIRTQERFPSSNLSQPASIRLCTLCFRVIQCSMECPETPPW